MLHDFSVIPFHPDHIDGKSESFFRQDRFFTDLKYYLSSVDTELYSVFYKDNLLMITGFKNFDGDVVLFWITVTGNATIYPKATLEAANALHLILGSRGFNKIIFTVDSTDKVAVKFADSIRRIKREGVSSEYRNGNSYLIYGGNCGTSGSITGR